jgi:polysaccharide pyruvyl transferase WcaK-like protein
MDKNYPKKILISGGWGYSNLGDDAILVSTIKLVKEKYPQARLVIMTYDCKDTHKNNFNKEITVVQSVHRVFSGKLSKIKLKILSDPQRKIPIKPGLLKRLKLKAQRVILNRLGNYLRKRFYDYMQNPEKLKNYGEFTDADLFIQAGGGYFLGSWTDSFYSRILELNIVNKLKIKSLIIGQSIGPLITEESKELVQNALKKVTLVSVRDSESFRELSDLGISPVLIPDTVLSFSDFNFKNAKEIAIILGSSRLNEEELSAISSSLKSISKKTNFGYKILVSRLWEPDVLNAHSIYHELTNKGVKAELVIPKNYEQLQDQLGHCSVVVSQNLHGLILGWRAGLPCVSLNVKRKFISFMEQTKQAARLIPMATLTEELLTRKVLDAIEALSDEDTLRHQISGEIRAAFNDCLDTVIRS